MKKITVSLLQHSYSICIDDSLKNIASELKRNGKAKYPKILIVTHPKLQKLYGKKLQEKLKSVAEFCAVTTIPEGEQSKNLSTVQELYRVCLKNKLDRSSCIVALGGGVVGDVSGFVAATYLRGIDLLQVPTSLLAMVDSSIGGKTGVDLPYAKNSVGAFHQPRLVWIDISLLKTLPEREFRNGMAEIIKYGVIADRALFKNLESWVKNKKEEDLIKIIERCVAIKARVVSEDEKETQGLREILNFGHTIGHAIESVTEYRVYKHGEAVALGMGAAAFIALQRRQLQLAEFERIKNLIAAFGLPTVLQKPLKESSIALALSNDKKVLSGKWRFVLPSAIGKVIVTGVSAPEAMKGFRSILPKIKKTKGH